MAKGKTAKIVLCAEFGDMAEKLGLDEKTRRRFLAYGEYADIELTVKPDMTFTGRFLPKGR